MLTYSLLPRLAEQLGLTHVRALRDGELGAAIVRDADGQEFVLKASTMRSAHQLVRAGALVERLRVRGYPAPLQIATGIAMGACWSLQERLPGESPHVLTGEHARRLIELAGTQAGAAGRRRNWRRAALPQVRAWSRLLTQDPHAGALARELAAVFCAHDSVELRDRDVVHNDFSHRNYLAVEDDVTGVVDWDLAQVGDWRLDLVTLAYWCMIEPAHVARDAAKFVTERLHEACPRDVQALFFAFVALRHLDFIARAHPDRLTALVDAIRERAAPSWRDATARHRAPRRRSA